MKKIIFALLFILVLMGVETNGIAYAQAPAGNPSYFQVSVTTNTLVLPFDGTVIDWTIHPRNGAVNCIPGLINGQASLNVPTTTFGMELISGGYYQNFTTPTVSVACTAESGTVLLDIWADHRY
jgi:hypothetical protein